LPAPVQERDLTVSRSGHLWPEYGERPVQLADGETIDRIDFALSRMSVMTGRVTDEGFAATRGSSSWVKAAARRSR
jgi:hypothetical protein